MIRPVDSLIIHTSDSPDDRYWVDAAEITRWHKERGFKTIGYHYVIKKDGTVEKGRDVNAIGAHCYGHNLHSIGIVWVGRHDCNAAQWKTLVDLCLSLIYKFNLKPSDIHGHSEFDKGKTCPNISMAQLRRDVEDGLHVRSA